MFHGLPAALFNWRQLEWYGRTNFLKGGLVFADAVTTVSPTHAHELRTAAGGFGLDIDLAVSLPGVPRAEAEALVAKAHEVCPYSNATRGNVDVRLTVV